MGALKENLSELGKTVGASLDEAKGSVRVIAGARERFLATLDSRTPSHRRLFVFAPWLAAAAVLGGVLLYFGTDGFSSGFGEKAPLSVTLEAQETELVGRWIGAEEETKQLRFSDGTSISLHPHTKLQIDATTASGATIVLGQGRALAKIEPLEGANWRFLAGPFTVRVTGTEFDLAWFPEKRTFEIALHQGSVELSGPTISAPKVVRKGDFVRVEVPERTASSVTADPGAPSSRSSDSSDSAAVLEQGDAALEQRVETKTSETRAKGTGSENGNWRALLGAGERKSALVAIERVGSQRVIAAASANELWAISDAARVGGKPALARDALLALREKHGTRGQTAYLLGKVYADQLHAPAEAIRWFDTYLSEAPQGALAEQALGRLVELQAGTGRGRRAAKLYLERYPRGSYADFARSSSR